MSFDFEISPEDLQVAFSEESAGGFSGPDSGLYPATLVAVYEVESNSSDSKAIEVMYETDAGYKGQQAIWYVGKNGRNTRVNDKGETVPTYGMAELQRMFAAVGVTAADVGASETTETIKRFGQDQQVKLYSCFTGRKVILGLRKKLEDGYNNPAEEKEITEVQLWANEAGQSGDELLGKHKPKTITQFEGIIAKNPVIDKRDVSKPVEVAEGTDTDGTDPAAEAALGGWGGN